MPVHLVRQESVPTPIAPVPADQPSPAAEVHAAPATSDPAASHTPVQDQRSMGYVHNAERTNSLGFDPATPLTDPFAHQQHIPAAPHQVSVHE